MHFNITGMPRLPIVGSYWHLLWHNYKYPYKSVRHYITKLQSKVITCYLGAFMTVIANDYNSVKEVLTKDDFDGRPTTVDVLLARSFGKKLGTFCLSRKFNSRTTRLEVMFHILNFECSTGNFRNLFHRRIILARAKEICPSAYARFRTRQAA